MKERRAPVLLLILTLLVSLLPFQIVNPILAQKIESEKPLHKIAFTTFGDGDIWEVNQDGSGLRQYNNLPTIVGGGYNKNIKWSPDGRGLGYDLWNEGYKRWFSGVFSELAVAEPLIGEHFVGWLPDSSAFVVEDKVYVSPEDKVGERVFFIVDTVINDKKYQEIRDRYQETMDRSTAKLLATLRQNIKNPGQAIFSPKYKYLVTTEQVSQPLSTEGMPDPFTNQILIKEVQTGELVANLSQRASGAAFWSERENKIAFYERDEVTLTEVLSIYSLSEGSTIRTTEAWVTNPVIFLPDGKKLLYVHQTGYEGSGANLPPGLSLLDLETLEKERLPGVSISYPSEGIPRENIKLAEAGTKLVYNTTRGDDSSSEGIFVYDFETKSLKQIARGWIWPGSWDVVGSSVVYALEGNLIITNLLGENPRVLVKRPLPPNYSVAFREVVIQPQIPPEKFKQRRALVLVQGIGSEVKEGHPRNVFPELWPIFDEAIARGIYQDVIIFSYAFGRMENGRWTPSLGEKRASFRSLKESALTFSRTLSEYATVHKGVTYDIIGHSLGGKVAWEYLKDFVIGKDIPSDFYKLGRLVTLNSPINGVNRDTSLRLALFLLNDVFQADDILKMVKVDVAELDIPETEAFRELIKESSDESAQKFAEAQNNLLSLGAAKSEISIRTLASTDDCIVRYTRSYPHREAALTTFGTLYDGLGRGTKTIKIETCSIVWESIDIIRSVRDDVEFNALLGHDRLFVSSKPWLDLKDLLLYNITPKRGVAAQ